MQNFKLGDKVKILNQIGTVTRVNNETTEITYHVTINSGMEYMYCSADLIKPHIIDGSNVVYVDFKDKLKMSKVDWSSKYAI
jgi:hypothetical protein